MLGYLEDGDDADEHLDVGACALSSAARSRSQRLTGRTHGRAYTEHPLADGFDLRQGHVRVTVPRVSPSNHYIVVCEWHPRAPLADGEPG